MWPGIEECRITDRQTASILVEGIEEASRCLDEALQKVFKYETADQRKLVAHAVGTVMGTTMHDLLMSLLTQHPSLDRHGLLSPPKGEGVSQDG